MNLGISFDKFDLKRIYLEELIEDFWYVASDAYLRAPEVAVWQSLDLKRPILNIGCGDGKVDRHLFRGFKIDVGLDLDKKAVKLAQKSGLYGKVIVASAENLPFQDGSFATVVANSTFEHIKGDIKAVSEVGRVLKSGGFFIFNTTSEKLQEELREVVSGNKKLKKLNKRVNHYHYRGLDEWKGILAKNNLELVSFKFYFPPELVRIWYKLFRLATFKPYKRELWSYLKDSPYGKIFPKSLIKKILMGVLENSYHKAFDKDGCWVFMACRKK